MSFKKRAPVGVESFDRLIDPENNYVFVDRTPMIQQIWQDGAPVIAFHTFRRGGKSLLASMLQYFFSAQVFGKNTAGMFENLEINKTHPEFVEKRQGKYPVVKISLKGVQKESFQEALRSVAAIVETAYRHHPYLKTSPSLNGREKEIYDFHEVLTKEKEISQDALENSLQILTELLFKHHRQKVIVIIDEYETPLTSSVLRDYFDSMALFMKNFLSAVMKTNDYLEKGILIGILRVSKESMLSGLNNIEVCTLLKTRGYKPYLGFTEQEVEGLFQQCGLSQDIDLAKQWYDGYLIGGQHLYNPWSIIHYIKDCLDDSNAQPGAYWTATANDDLLKYSLLAMPNQVKEQFRQLVLNGEPVRMSLSETIQFEDVKEDSAAMWGLFYAAGYVTAVTPLMSEGFHYNGLIRIPNQEIRELYVDIFATWLRSTVKADSYSIFEWLCQGQVNEFGKLIGEYLLQHTSHRNLKSEGCYHNLLLGLSFGLIKTYHVLSDNRESGLGYPDMLIVPKTKEISNLAIVLEFKRVIPGPKEKKRTIKTIAAEALKQIDERQYVAALADYPHVTRVSKVGMAFQGKELHWEAVEESLV